MKNKFIVFITILLIIICTIIATITKSNDKVINYTFFMSNNSIYNLYDNYGNKILNDGFVYVEKTNNNHILVVTKDKKYGIIDKVGNFLVNYDQYEKIEKYGNLYLAYNENEIYFIKENNEIIRKLESSKEIVSRIVDNYAVLLHDNNYYVYNKNGELVITLEYKKKKKISFKESKNYALITYGKTEYLFNINEVKYEERKVDNVSDIEENGDILLIKGDNNRIYYNGEIKLQDFECDLPEFINSLQVKCNDTLLFEPENIYSNENKIYYGEYNVVCDNKCTLYKDNKDILKGLDEIKVLNTNMKKYIYGKKGNKTIIYDDSFNVIYSTKRVVELQNNCLKIDNKFYTYEGNVINL